MLVPIVRRVKPKDSVLVERVLPGAGRILVKAGEIVKADDIVGEAEVSDGVREIDFSQMFGLSATETPGALLKKIGETVTQGEPLIRVRRMLGLRNRIYIAPVDGVVTSIEAGKMVINFSPTEVQLTAGFDGVVEEVKEGQAVSIRCSVASLQGVTGTGDERFGRVMLVGKQGDILLPQDIDATATDKIIVGGALLTADTLMKAQAIGVKGIVCGGINFHDSIGWIPGKDLGISVVVMEGYGLHPLNEQVVELAKNYDGHYAAIFGELGTVHIAIDQTVKQAVIPTWKEAVVGDAARILIGESLGVVGKITKTSRGQLPSGIEANMVTLKSTSGEVTTAVQDIEIIEL